MGELSGRVALVTGASRGIGKGCALELGAAGAKVYVTGRTFERSAGSLGTLRETAEEITALGGEGIAIQCDHRDDDQVAAVFDRVCTENGRLDVLVNSAFIIPDELTLGLPFWECPISNWDDMVGVGTRSAYVASWHAAKLMIPSRRGLIASISSSGATEYAWHVAYGVGKAALDRLTADMGRELTDFGVACVSLWPGLVRTEHNEAIQADLPQLDFSAAESSRFTGRAVAALAADPNVLERSGHAHSSRDLAIQYGFTDVDGRLPPGPLRDRSRRA